MGHPLLLALRVGAALHDHGAVGGAPPRRHAELLDEQGRQRLPDDVLYVSLRVALNMQLRHEVNQLHRDSHDGGHQELPHRPRLLHGFLRLARNALLDSSAEHVRRPPSSPAAAHPEENVRPSQSSNSRVLLLEIPRECVVAALTP